MYGSTTLEQLLHRLQGQELHLTLVRARVRDPSSCVHPCIESPRACIQAAERAGRASVTKLPAQEQPWSALCYLNIL